MADYKATIGIECHVQLKTKSKLFAAVDNDAREAKPNTLISHICLGLPGSLPVLNKEAITLAAKAAFALGSRPQPFSKFDRKHYFYPDLPMGYQITQYEEPIIMGGQVDIYVEGKKKTIGITRAHLEADAGKSTHPAGKEYSLVDLNRAGTPLLEIVSEPEIHSPAEAKAYAYELYLLMKYAGVSDVDLYHGNMRFDVNVSISPDKSKLGTRTETKNLNSFRSVEKAAEYEIKRQTDLLDHGKAIIQETRGWDDAKQKTFSQRSKEDAHDYRYFPDPDLPPVVLDDAYMDGIEAAMPPLPGLYRKNFNELGLDDSQVESLLFEVENACIVYEFGETYGQKAARILANWITGEVQRWVTAGTTQWADVSKRTAQIKALVDLLLDNKLSSTAAKEVLAEILRTGEKPLEVAKKLNLLQQSDESELIKIVEEVVLANQQAANDIKNGEMKAIGFLVGQVMKNSGGKANPTVVQDLIKKTLGV